MPPKKLTDTSSMALTAMALQDHWTRTLSLGPTFGPRKVGAGPAARAVQRKKHEVKPMVDTGRNRARRTLPKSDEAEVEYVLDEKPPPLTLAQKFGLVQKPKQLLSEEEWSGVKAKSNQRDDSGEPCVICKEDFGLQEQVILSCTHVFHKACLQAFERFTGRKTCPMCRHEQYQTRVIHEGARIYKHKSAAKIQSWWRGYVVRSWYKKLRETVPPKDPLLKKKFYEEKLTGIVDRMIKSLDVNMTEFLREIDSSVQQSRAVFSQWDAMHNPITPEMWDAIQLKAVERGDTDCPICLTELHLNVANSGLSPTCHNSPDHDQHYHQQQSQRPHRAADHAGLTNNAETSNKKCSRKSQDRKLLEKLSGAAGSPFAKTNGHTGPNNNNNAAPCQLPREDETRVSHKNSQHKDTDTSRNDTSGSQYSTPLPASGDYCKPRKCAQRKLTFATQSVREIESGSVSRPRRVRATVLLSCTHVFHSTCLRTLEEMAMVDMRNTCPVCRAHYQKKVITF